MELLYILGAVVGLLAVSAVLNKCVDWWRERDPERIARQARRQEEREREEQERQAEQARLEEGREREEQKRQEKQALLEKKKRLINRARKAEESALEFAVATKDSEFEDGGEIELEFPENKKRITLHKHASVSGETIERIDRARESAALCYIAHGFMCVAEKGEESRVRLFSPNGEMITPDNLAFWSDFPKYFPDFEMLFYNRYGTDPVIDIVKERRIAVGELPPGDYPVFECRAGEGAECGYIYVASNVESFGEGVVKIGMTTRDPAERIRELNSTSVPTDFSYNLILATPNARKAERIIHNALHNRRVNKEKKKEFFRISPKELEEVLSSLAGKPIRMKRKNAV